MRGQKRFYPFGIWQPPEVRPCPACACGAAARTAASPRDSPLSFKKVISMATSAQRRLQPKEIRRFGSQRAPHGIPDLTQIQTRGYDAFLQQEVPWQKRTGPGDRRGAAGNLPRRELRQDAAAGVSPLRTGQAALRAGRVPATAADLRPALQGLAPAHQGAAGRGGSLPGRHPHHARRRRVHHQRGRTRGGQPVAPQPGRRFRHGNRGRRRPPLAQLPHHSRTRKLDRTERHPQGKPRPSASTRAASSRS